MKSEGECKFCKKTFAGTAMKKHLIACAERNKANASDKGEARVFLMKASASPFWIYFEVNATSTLGDIDSFLRDIWLECCGHLSQFIISDVHYASSPDSEYEDKSMNIQLQKVMRQGMKFVHEYDFGTTTVLDIECVSERAGKAKKDVEIIARNNMPDFRCDKCGKPAKEICTECVYNGEGLLCKECAKKHECGEDMLLPLVNSPRTGMCGYTG